MEPQGTIRSSLGSLGLLTLIRVKRTKEQTCECAENLPLELPGFYLAAIEIRNIFSKTHLKSIKHKCLGTSIALTSFTQKFHPIFYCSLRSWLKPSARLALHSVEIKIDEYWRFCYEWLISIKKFCVKDWLVRSGIEFHWKSVDQ